MICPECKTQFVSDSTECPSCRHAWGESKPSVEEHGAACAGCRHTIDWDLRNDNPLCDACINEAHVNDAMHDLVNAVERMKLAVKFGINVKLEAEWDRITGAFKLGYVAGITNIDAAIVATGIGRTVKEASDRALEDLKQQIEKVRSAWAA